MTEKHIILKGTFVLTLAAFISRFLGFFYRMYLSHTFGEANVGLYQLIFPVYTLGIAITCAGIQTALSRHVAGYVAKGKKKETNLLLFTSMIPRESTIRIVIVIKICSVTIRSITDIQPFI